MVDRFLGSFHPQKGSTPRAEPVLLRPSEPARAAREKTGFGVSKGVKNSESEPRPPQDPVVKHRMPMTYDK